MFMMSWPKKLVFCCRASKMIGLSVSLPSRTAPCWSSIQQLHQHRPWARRFCSVGGSCIEVDHVGLQSGSPEEHSLLQDTYNSTKYYKMAYIIVWCYMICRPMCLLLSVVICVSFLTRVSSPMQWTSFHLSHAHPYRCLIPWRCSKP